MHKWGHASRSRRCNDHMIWGGCRSLRDPDCEDRRRIQSDGDDHTRVFLHGIFPSIMCHDPSQGIFREGTFYHGLT